jgi:hypothetical protein
VPVCSLDGRRIGAGAPGPVFASLGDAFRAALPELVTRFG